MRNVFAAGAIVAAGFSGAAQAQSEIAGNWYASAVKALTYTGFGGSGSYNQVTSMDPNTGSCSNQPIGYTGSLAPMNDQISFHHRGPIHIVNFAFYTPGGASSKKAKRTSHAEKHHGHAHFHAHNKEVREAQEQAQKRGLGEMITATIDGKVVSWANEYNGGAAATPVAAAAGGAVTPAAAQAPKSAAAGPAYVPSASGDWVRTAYYDAASGTAEGITFLNNHGGENSGIFDTTFGMSLSYASSDGQSGAAGPQVLADTTLPSNTEIVIMTDKPCTEAVCGYSREGTVAYEGFDTSNGAVAMFEFEMPHDSSASGGVYSNADMPAIWALNAQIPRTLQYGNAACSCWDSGCGEIDLFEVLTPGFTEMKSTFHGNQAGGSSDYFVRPTTQTMKASMYMGDNTVTLQVLGGSYDFSSTLTNAQVSQLSAQSGSSDIGDLLTGLFALGA